MDEDGTQSADAIEAAYFSQDLSTLSVTDLEERAARLAEEIRRCEAAMEARKASLNTAESLFKL